MSDQNPRRVLLVDDDPGDRLLVAMQLERIEEPVELLVAETLKEARAVLKQSPIDCVVLDWNLPDARGLEAITVLRDRVPIVVLTGMDRSRAREALEGGAQDYVLKDGLTGRSLYKSISYAIVRYQSSQLHQKLQQTQRLGTIGQLAAGVAHEVNNPACWIKSNQETISSILDQLAVEHDSPLLDEMRTLLAENVTGIGRITRVVSRLKTFSREWNIDARSCLDLPRLLEDACTVAMPETRHRAEISVELEPDLPDVYGDHSSLVHVLVNLLINACHALDERPSSTHIIRMFARRNGNTVVLGVEDTGGGIPVELRDRVLEPFFTTKSIGRGTGLGLSIAGEVATQHGGHLDIADSVLGGARVSIALPVRRVVREPVVVSAPAPVEVSQRLKILLIDDEPAILRALSRALAQHTVVTASSGLEALQKIRAEPDLDLILCDLSMPQMTGAQVFSHAIRWDARLRERFVIITGGAVTPSLRRFLDEEAVRVLHKPFNRASLQEMLQEFYCARRAQDGSRTTVSQKPCSAETIFRNSLSSTGLVTKQLA